MAASTNIFTEKETNNWFKVCLALNCTKEGLTNFIEKELQRVHAAVGGSCGNCSIENLMSCPTPGLCNNRKRNNCRFHQTKVFQQCQICDQVKQKIISFHRFYNPSWRNTKAERWATEPWEIGKCYLPPDGYKGVSVVQESDLNGILSLMLNCTHFETCLSASLSPKPPDPQCPLEKVRQIGRDVRHTADCKLNDADLQYYFQTLATLLADPKCLMHDPLAITARTKLTQLQNDRLSLFELGEMLKDANQTLKQAKEAGKHFSKVAEITLQEALQSIEATIQAGKQHIETVISDSKKQLDIHTQDSVRKISEETRVGIERIQQVEINQAMDDYGRDVDDMLRGLTAHYDEKLSYVTTSPLKDCVQEKLRDIYMPPKLLVMTKDKQSFKKTGMQIKNYDNMFLKYAEENHKTFIQGEAGTGKSTFLAKLVMDWCRIKLEKQLKTKIAHTETQTNYAFFFKDYWSLHRYNFVFHITLRNSVTEISIYNMIKEQIIDSIYSSEEDRKKAYTLLNEIMKRELCLILLDGLDEWTGPGGGNNLPKLVTSHRQCVILITTRPWKVAEGTFNHSEMHTLLQLEGVNDPVELSRNLLSLIIDRKELSAKHLLFKRYVTEKKLNDLLLSPMMLSVILCSYAEGITLKGSKCEIYCIILESLLKKANSKISEFQHPPFPCFTGTQYIQPNIEQLNRLAEAAFHLLFSNTRENSLVFGISELKLYKLEEELDTALKSGILSATPKASVLRLSSSFSFIHKSLQEFLAAYHIARNTQTINGIISGYLKRNNNSYLDVTEVLTFLCGLDISAANTLSDMMDKCDQLHYRQYEFKPSPFQHCVLSGYREAIANAQTCINLKLSHFNIDDENIHSDLHSLWVMNASSVEVLRVTVFSRDPLFDGKSSPECEKSSSTMDFELASCHKLRVLKLYGYGVCLKAKLRNHAELVTADFRHNASMASTKFRNRTIREIDDFGHSAILGYTIPPQRLLDSPFIPLVSRLHLTATGMLEILRKPCNPDRLTRSSTALEEEFSTPMPTMPPASTMHPLARFHRKENPRAWKDALGDKAKGMESINMDTSKRQLSENRLKSLLEELYADKKYFDYSPTKSFQRSATNLSRIEISRNSVHRAPSTSLATRTPSTRKTTRTPSMRVNLRTPFTQINRLRKREQLNKKQKEKLNIASKKTSKCLEKSTQTDFSPIPSITPIKGMSIEGNLEAFDTMSLPRSPGDSDRTTKEVTHADFQLEEYDGQEAEYDDLNCDLRYDNQHIHDDGPRLKWKLGDVEQLLSVDRSSQGVSTRPITSLNQLSANRHV
ncbi:hypothetical protein DPMN_126722 [Dreissena polymorpha]|uniref:NACHT domain-containing protein n=1 Tax=Dreissena polymorpha TaxID=45954 RepID=A0A9D4JYF0_DREPO|nr:hypothetical protein DPMN_126722 [Dreissena polymorpha]